MPNDTIARTLFPATPPQLRYIESLLRSKDLSDALKADLTELVARPDFTKVQASAVLDQLTSLADKPRSGAVATGASHLAGLPCSKYALKRSEMGAAAHLVRPDTDLGFFEVRTYRGHTYMRQLFGAPGSFSRVRFAHRDDELAVAALIRVSPPDAALRFANNYKCCAKCGADLTVKESRDLGLGPTCRVAFGL